jgi:hypothetical protein
MMGQHGFFVAAPLDLSVEQFVEWCVRLMLTHVSACDNQTTYIDITQRPHRFVGDNVFIGQSQALVGGLELVWPNGKS